MNDARHDPETKMADASLRLGSAGYTYTIAPWPESVDMRLALNEAELSRLREANDYLAGRVAALEADGRTWRGTLEAHGDALQTLTLRGAP